jgi:hypothetical protein
MYFNAPPTIMHSLTHPDAAEKVRSDRRAGWPVQAYWFVYWSSVRPRNGSAQKGAGLRALRNWTGRS